jgi:hypothetical protein
MSKASILKANQVKYKEKGKRTQINFRLTQKVLDQMAELQDLLDLHTRADAVRCAINTALDIARKEAGK